MKTDQDPTNIDDLAANAVRLGRDLARRAQAMHLGGTSADAAFVSRCLSSLADRDPFSPAIDGGLDAVRGILEREIATEIVGHEERFVETHFDETGPHGEIREVPIHSQRGVELLELRALFRRFEDARGCVLDHLAAHRALLDRMSG